MKRTACLLLAIGFSLPVIAQAEDLAISNHTSYDLSLAFNQKCASDFGNVPSRTIRTMPEQQFNQLCKDGCELNVYDKKDCKGQLVAKFVYDMKKQVVHVYGTGLHKISVAVSGFYHLFFSEPMNQ